MLIKVKVWVGEKREGIVKKVKDSFEVRVREKAEQGRANRQVRELLAGYFKVKENKVKLIKGSKQRNKIFNINIIK